MAAKAKVPQGPWRVGLAKAPALAGPWQRYSDLNPSPIEKKFIENPIVSRIGQQFVAIYDSSPDETNPNYVIDGRHVGFSVSTDGIHWPPGRMLDVQSDVSDWSEDIRTPLSLIQEEKGVYTILYTAKLKEKLFWAVGLVRVKVKIFPERVPGIED